MEYTDHILIVDDEAGIVKLIEAILRKANYTVTTTTSSRHALELLNQQSFRLVISDLMMPNIDGLELLKEIKACQLNTEFILITAFGSMESAVEALREGAFDYINKPVSKDVLLHSVKKALQYQQYKQDKQQLLETLQQHNKSMASMLEASNRLAHLSPLPGLIATGIVEIAQQHLGYAVAVSALTKDEISLETVTLNQFENSWWVYTFTDRPISVSAIKKIFSKLPRFSHSYLLDPQNDLVSQTLNLDLDRLRRQARMNLQPALAIPLYTRGGQTSGVLWIAGFNHSVSLEEVKRLEIFANQITGTLENTQLFTQQLNQLRVRNALVNAGQRIATVLDHREVANTVLEAVLKIIPTCDVAAIYYRPKLKDRLQFIGVTRHKKSVEVSPLDQAYITEALTQKRTIHKSWWQATETSPVQSIILEPLALSTVSLGLLVTIGKQPDAFSQDHQQLLKMLANQAAIALQNATLYAEAQRVDEIEALYEAGKAIDRTLNLQETLTTTMAVSRSLTGASISNVYLYSPERHRIDSVVTLSEEVNLTDTDRRRAAAIARRVIKEHSPSLVTESQFALDLPDDTVESKNEPYMIRTWLAVPLPKNESILGVLELGSQRVETFTANDVRLMQIISSHAAAAIEKARLYEEVQQRLQQTEALYAISQSISTTLDLDRVLDLVVQSVAKNIPVVTHSSLYLINHDNDTIEAKVQVSTKNLTAPEEVLQAQQKAVARAMQQCSTIGKTLHTKNHGSWSLLAEPLKVGASILGAISVKSPRVDAFQSSDTAILKSFASHASIGILNANLFRDLSVAYTNLSQKQDELLASHNTLQTLFDGITDGLYIVDRDLRLIAINQAEADRLDTTPQALAGCTCNQELWADAAPTIIELVSNTFDSGKEGIWESQTDTGNHHLFTDRDVHTYPIFDASGQVRQVILFAQDVSEKRRLQASLFRSANMAAVGQLASSVAHQINNPLTVIIANSQIMEMDTSPDLPNYSMLKHIEEAGTHIRKIVQNLLDFSTQDSYEWFETSIEETIEDALILVTHSLRKSDIEVDKQINAMPTIIASASHLKLLWMNLLLNARDAAAGNERSGRILITAGQVDTGAVEIKIIDNGSGIPPQIQDLLFHPFFTTKSSGKNLGLGLFTCESIVDVHQGEIQLENNPDGPGTVVTVVLPLSPEMSIPVITSA